eukprot:jgi/Mesvir1/24282/Mv10980-RA.1
MAAIAVVEVENFDITRFAKESLPVVVAELNKVHGPLLELLPNDGSEPVFVATHPGFAQHVLRPNGKFSQRFGNPEGLATLHMHEQGVIWNNTEEDWKAIRKCIESQLTAKQLQRAVEISREATLSYCQHWTGTSAPIDVLKELRVITLAIVLELFFGIIGKPHGFLLPLTEEVVAYFKAWEYCLFRSGVEASSSPRARHAVDAVNALTASITKLIPEARSDFMDKLKTLQSEHNWSQEQIVQIVLEVVIAGTDTSSVTMSYALLGMCDPHHVGLAQRIQAQATQLCEAMEAGEVPKQAALDKHMPTLHKLLLESMRFKPVGPVVLRKCTASDPYGDVPLEPGDRVILNLAAMHRSEDLFEQPESFDPECNFAAECPKFVPFGKGPKGCVGQHLAKVEMLVVMSTLVHKFDFSLAEGQVSLNELTTHWDIANQPTSPIYLVARPRC